MNKKCIYTIIVNKYDNLKEPFVKCDGWDFLCFSDMNYQSDTWKIINIDIDTSAVRTQRHLKIIPPQEVLKYDYSVYCDGSMSVISDINKLCDDLQYPVFASVSHPHRKCLYEEVMACIRFKKCDKNKLLSQMGCYRNENMPIDYGLIESGVLLRQHNDLRCVEFCEKWWSEIIKHTHRDQISFPYIEWKMNVKFTTFSPKIRNRFFKLHRHKRK